MVHFFFPKRFHQFCESSAALDDGNDDSESDDDEHQNKIEEPTSIAMTKRFSPEYRAKHIIPS